MLKLFLTFIWIRLNDQHISYELVFDILIIFRCNYILNLHFLYGIVNHKIKLNIECSDNQSYIVLDGYNIIFNSIAFQSCYVNKLVIELLVYRNFKNVKF